MKISMKKLQRWFVGILMLLLVPILVISGFATELTDSYGISAGTQEPIYQYGSRYQCAYAILDESLENGIWSGWNAPEIWNLSHYDGSHTYAIAAFPVAAEPLPQMDDFCGYSKENMDGEKWEKLGAILLKSYPYLTICEIEQDANAYWGSDMIRNLNEGEAITAAQQAIWKVYYGERFISQKLYVSLRGMGEFNLEQFRFPESLQNANETVNTSTNIQNLYLYYLSLSTQVHEKDPGCGFSDVHYEANRLDDGTYQVYVSFQIENPQKETDLKLTVSCGTVFVTESVKEREMRFCFSGLEQPEAVELVLHSVRYVWEPACFMPEGDGPILIGCCHQKQERLHRMKAGTPTAEEQQDEGSVFTINVDQRGNNMIARNLMLLLKSGGIVLICVGLWIGLHCLWKKI